MFRLAGFQLLEELLIVGRNEVLDHRREQHGYSVDNIHSGEDDAILLALRSGEDVVTAVRSCLRPRRPRRDSGRRPPRRAGEHGFRTLSPDSTRLFLSIFPSFSPLLIRHFF